MLIGINFCVTFKFLSGNLTLNLLFDLLKKGRRNYYRFSSLAKFTKMYNEITVAVVPSFPILFFGIAESVEFHHLFEKFFFNPCQTSEYSCCKLAVSIANFVGRMM